jgi:hypothetical protein
LPATYALRNVILNPFSPEGVKWNALDEISNEYDVDRIDPGTSMPAHFFSPSRSKFWLQESRTMPSCIGF